MSKLDRFREWSEDHPNFMTPDIVELFTHDGLIIELSKGYSHLTDSTLYGVAVFRENQGEHGEFEAVNHDLNLPFSTEDEARKRVAVLRNDKLA